MLSQDIGCWKKGRRPNPVPIAGAGNVVGPEAYADVKNTARSGRGRSVKQDTEPERDLQI